MKTEEYQILLNDALARNETIVFSCKCRIRYSGRAESFLDWGDRIIMIKNDNTLLVHQPTGNTPINYMKTGSSYTLRCEHDQLILKSQNITQKETMEITISKMHFFNSHKLEDGQVIRVSGTEEDMSNMIYNNPEMIEEGFKPVSQEEQTKYGFIDVFGHDKGILTIIECKRYNADLGAVTQLRRYVEKMKKDKGLEKVNGIIAAPKISANALKMLQDWGFEYRKIDPPKYFEEKKKKQASLKSF